MAIDINIQERLECTIHLATPITAETSTTDGEWMDAAGYDAMTYHIDGMNGETVEIRGSNTPTQPLSSTHHVQLGADVTADGIYTVVTPVAWIKVMISAGGAGTVNAYFLGVPKKTR